MRVVMSAGCGRQKSIRLHGIFVVVVVELVVVMFVVLLAVVIVVVAAVGVIFHDVTRIGLIMCVNVRMRFDVDRTLIVKKIDIIVHTTIIKRRVVLVGFVRVVVVFGRTRQRYVR